MNTKYNDVHEQKQTIFHYKQTLANNIIKHPLGVVSLPLV